MWNFIFGCYAILILYHLLIFIDRPKDKSNLAYSLFLITYMSILILHRNEFFVSMKINNNTLYEALRILIIFLLSSSIVYLLSTLFNLNRVNKIMIINLAILLFFTVLCILLLLIFNFKIIKKVFYMYAAISVIGIMFFSLKEIILLKQFKSLKNIIIILGLCWIGVSSFTMAILNSFSGLLPPQWLPGFASLITFFAFAYAIAKGFNNEHRELIDLKNTLEQKVDEKTKELKLATEEKINFFINYTHENRTPLTIIDNNLNLHIKNKGVTPELSHVKYNVDKLKHNTNNLLDFEKLERSHIFYNNDNNVNLSDFLNTKIDMFNKIADSKKIKIIRNINKNIYVDTDNYAIDRIINNLLDNAVKYTDKKGKITVSLKAINEKINLVIKDSGFGISKEQLKNIFKPYHQLSHKKRNIQGIGMGLNIVKKILDEINGEINVDSELNKGSTFTIILNKSMNKKGEKINKEELTNPRSIVKVDLLEEKYNKDKPTILIIEDDLEIIELLQKFFYDTYNIFYSINGKEALVKIETIPEKPDLLISDIMMDEMDGYKFYEKLLEIEKYKDVPFIFLTAKVGEENRLSGLEKGAIDFIEKPFNIEDLKLKFNNLIKLKKEQVKMTYLNLDKERKQKFDNMLKINKITSLEKSIIIYVNNGLFNKEIAFKLKIAEQTVKNHLSDIYKKMNVTGRTELIKNIQDYCN